MEVKEEEIHHIWGKDYVPRKTTSLGCTFSFLLCIDQSDPDEQKYIHLVPVDDLANFESCHYRREDGVYIYSPSKRCLFFV